MSPVAEAASDLAAASSYFCASFNAARDGMVIFSNDRRYVAANPAACQLLGVDSDGLTGRCIDEFVPPALSEELVSDWASFLSAGHRAGEYELVRKDNASITVEYTATAHIAPGYHLALIRDVTERKHREELLKRQRRQLVDAQSVGKIGSFEWDPVADRLEWSDELHRIFGVEPGTVTSLAMVRELVHPDDRALLESVVETALSTLEPFSWECRTLLTDGSVRVLESHGEIVVDGDGTLLRMIGTAQDITERREAEKALAAAHAKAVEASRLKSEFMANMNHELRTPLNGVIGTASLLAETNLDHEQRQYVHALQVSGEALLSVIGDILDFSKLHAGKIDLDNEPFELHAIVENIRWISAGNAAAKGVRLTASIDESLAPIVRGDANRLRQALTNLIDNAIKFTPAGEVAIRVLRAHMVYGEPCVRFEVADTGIGIDARAQDAIFESFVQADGSTSRRYGGTGLGLSITKHLVTLMGGTIGVHSTPGQGSTFWLTLPLHEVEATPDSPCALDVAPEEHPPQVPPTDGAPHVSGRVLVAEDNPINQLVAIRLLEQRGLRVEVASDGREALAMHTRQPYNAIFMDCQMPELDGYETTHAIRQSEGSARHTPIIAMTAHTMPGDRERCIAAGMDYYCGKPLRATGLDYILARALPPADPAGPERGHSQTPIRSPSVDRAPNNVAR